jgi:murein hydrolase activator
MRSLLLVGMLCGLLPVLGWSATVQEATDQLKTYQNSIHQERKGLSAVKQKIRQKKKAVQQKKRKERSVLFEIQRIGKKLEEADDRHQDHQENLRMVRNQIARARFDVNLTEKEMKRLRAFLASRVQLIYRERQSGFWRIVATSQSLPQALRRLKFFHVMATQNAFLIRQLMQKQKMLIQQTQQLMGKEQKAEELEIAAQQSLKRITKTRSVRKRYLQKVRHERTKQEKALKELEQASKRLNRLVRKLEQRARRMKKKIALLGKQFSRRKRTLPWPTRGRVVSRFGKKRHPRFNTYIYNKGIDIKGSIGQNVFSVSQGHVLFAEWFEGYGRMIILDHGGGYNTVYAHLNKILVSEGDAVTEGKTIGTLGDSGTWKGPALYFEIRKRGKAVNPIPWLEK